MYWVKNVFNAVGSSENKYQQLKDISKETGKEEIMYPLEWWKNRRGLDQKKELRCANWFCSNPAEVGAHVIDYPNGNHVYIVPTCKACNNKGDSFYSIGERNLEECTQLGSQRELLQKSVQRLQKIKDHDLILKTKRIFGY